MMEVSQVIDLTLDSDSENDEYTRVDAPAVKRKKLTLDSDGSDDECTHVEAPTVQ